MKSISFTDYIKPFILATAVIFFCIYFISSPKVFKDYTECIGYTVTAMTIISWIYIQFGWYFSPWERIPRLSKKYTGMIKYCYKGVDGEKCAEIFIKQTLLFVSIKIKTNQIVSDTICGNIILEHDNYVLYYTYQTNPHGTGNEENPIRRGTCRIALELKTSTTLKDYFIRHAAKRLNGNYWTDGKTTGDIFLCVADGEEK